MTECNQLDFKLPGLKRRRIEGIFRGGNVSGDGGLVVLRQADRWLGLSKALADRLPDRCDPDKIEHSQLGTRCVCWPAQYPYRRLSLSHM